MPNTKKSPDLLLCSGTDCFKKANAAYEALAATAENAGLAVGTVKCQGACSGPTAVVVGADGPRWFEDLKGKKVQRDLCVFVADTQADLPKRLARKELTGKAKAKAASRLKKQTSSK